MSVAENVTVDQDQELLSQAAVGVQAFLASQKEAGRITGTYYDDAVGKTVPNLKKWLLSEELDKISPNVRDGIRQAIKKQQWEALTNAYSRDVSFGTGGIREKMGATRDVVLQLKNEGIHAPIVKGPNTINDVVLLLTSAGVAKFGVERKPQLEKVVIGFDSRVCGKDFARAIATLFLAYDYTVFIFDEACSYPSVTFAVPTLKADVGVFISASHNDFRYNGYKLSCANGSQFDPAERATLYKDYITKTEFSDIKMKAFTDAPKDKLWFLGGQKSESGKTVSLGAITGLPLADPLSDVSKDHYAGREDQIIDLHTMHTNHVKSFLLRPDKIEKADKPLTIGFSAFNGSGRKIVPRLLNEMGIHDVKRIMKLDALDGMFPAFCSDPGFEQQPDPGDWRSADIAVEAYKHEHADAWNTTDLIIGTDPDADRLGVIVKLPEHQQKAYVHPGTGEHRDYILLWADDVWSLILWYRLSFEIEKYGKIRDAETKFITLSHTTTDMLARIARKYDIGVMRTWVGFAQLAAATRAVWDLHGGKDADGITKDGHWPKYDEGRTDPADAKCNRSIHSWEAMDDTRRNFNIAALEQSNGFSLLGGPPPDARSLGEGGHVRDKDGTFAAALVAELAAYAKDQGCNLIDLIDEKLYLDPDIGLFVTYYEPDPIDGEYEGLAGYTKKRGILNKAEELFANHKDKIIELGGMSVKHAVVYRTGKYDAINWEGFPDEGYRFYFDDDRLSHMTIRPSGTSNALRFHVQLFGGHPSRETLIDEKARLRATMIKMVEDVRTLIGAPK